MFPFPQNPNWGTPPEPLKDRHSRGLRGRQSAQTVPRVAKSQLLRLALAERMCDIEVEPATPPWAPQGGWQPACAPQGGVITPPTARWSPRWETMGYGDNLLRIKAFSKACISTSAADTSAFTHTARGWKANRLGKSFLEVAPLIEFWSRGRHGDVRCDPQVQLAVDVFQQVGLLERTAMGPLGQVECWYAQGYAIASVAVRVNAFVEELGKRGRLLSNARKMQHHEDLHAARGRDVRSYLKGVLKRHPACHVLRLELCMSRNTKLNRQEEYDFMLEASGRYMCELKGFFGEAIVADVRKIDRGSTSNYLVHLLIALAGPGPDELVAIRQAAIDHWMTQPQGIGYAVNCDAVNAFTYRGTNSHPGRREPIANQMENAAIFLADTDRIIHVGWNEGQDGLVIGKVSGL